MPACVHPVCADLAGPLARLLVERLGGCQNGLIDRLVGGHQQQLGLIVILTISKLIFVIYLPLLYCLFLLGLCVAGRGGAEWGGAGRGEAGEEGLAMVVVWRRQEEEGGEKKGREREREAERGGREGGKCGRRKLLFSTVCTGWQNRKTEKKE